MAGTGYRNRHNVGSYLMQDDESGFTEYRENMVKRWDGMWVRKDQFETRQPQEFVQARNDPRPLRHVRPEPLAEPPFLAETPLIGQTKVATPTGPASHLFSPGVGEMIIGRSFVVR